MTTVVRNFVVEIVYPDGKSWLRVYDSERNAKDAYRDAQEANMGKVYCWELTAPA